MSRFAKHLPHYASLIGIFLAAIVAFNFFSYDKFFEVGVAVATAAAYVVWGLIHHAIHRDLYLVTIIEYISIAILGLVVILSVIYRA